MGCPNNGAKTMNKDLNLVEIHQIAREAAKHAALEYFNNVLNGRDRLPCGFSYVVINDNVRANSKLGKQLEAVGFHKGTSKRYEIGNVSGVHVQNVDTKEAACEAYAAVLRDHGIDACTFSRLD
jgi:hypothetical protein